MRRYSIVYTYLTNLCYTRHFNKYKLAHEDRKLQDVLLYIPNIVGYVRLALLALAIGIGRQEQYYISFYILVLNIALDAVDGILARALHQVWSPLLS